MLLLLDNADKLIKSNNLAFTNLVSITQKELKIHLVLTSVCDIPECSDLTLVQLKPFN